MLLVEVAVREDDVVYTLVYTGFSLMTQVVERLTKSFLALCYLKEDRQLLGVEALVADVTKYIKLCVGQYGSSSRMGSMAGLVTCANCWRK